MNKSFINISNSFLCRRKIIYLVSFYCLILLYSLSNCLSVIDKCVDSHKLNYNQILIHQNRDHICVNIEDNVRLYIYDICLSAVPRHFLPFTFHLITLLGSISIVIQKQTLCEYLSLCLVKVIYQSSMILTKMIMFFLIILKEFGLEKKRRSLSI